MTESKKLNHLIKKIIDDFEWGPPHTWSTKYFRLLADILGEKAGNQYLTSN